MTIRLVHLGPPVLALAARGQGREVLISRSRLVEIGGGCRYGEHTSKFLV